MTFTRTLMGLVAGLVLAGCGGGGNPLPAVDLPPTVPASASASAQAFVQYVGALPADDAAEPLSLDGLTPPASDSDEPQALD